jgi:hypothetical protein
MVDGVVREWMQLMQEKMEMEGGELDEMMETLFVIFYVDDVYMLLPICTQFCYANGDSPYAKFLAFLPVCIRQIVMCQQSFRTQFHYTYGDPHFYFVLISAACPPVPRLYAYRDPNL